MGTINTQNRTTFVRCPKDEQHPFYRLPVELLKLNGYQLAIMVQLLSNNDDWNIVKSEISKRLGFPERKFLKAWRELENLGYIQIRRMWGCYHYTICEDPGYTTGTTADCIDHTTGNSTSCTGAILTTINNNNYYRDVTNTAGSTCQKSQFNELLEIYPSLGTMPDGTTYQLKGNLMNCKKAYTDYLKKGIMTHDEIIKALKVELSDKQGTGKTNFQKGLLKWIADRTFEQYKGRTLEPIALGYGQILE